MNDCSVRGAGSEWMWAPESDKYGVIYLGKGGDNCPLEKIKAWTNLHRCLAKGFCIKEDPFAHCIVLPTTVTDSVVSVTPPHQPI
jgi:hypothetical protein